MATVDQERELHNQTDELSTSHSSWYELRNCSRGHSLEHLESSSTKITMREPIVCQLSLGGHSATKKILKMNVTVFTYFCAASTIP